MTDKPEAMQRITLYHYNGGWNVASVIHPEAWAFAPLAEYVLETPLTKAAGEMQDILLRLVDKTYSEESSLDTILSSLVADARIVLVKVKGDALIEQLADWLPIK